MRDDRRLFKKLFLVFSHSFSRIGIAVRCGIGHLHRLAADFRYRFSVFYKENGKLPLKILKNDFGRYGEYLLYDRLRREKGQWLFNLYLPHGREYTEVDALLLSPAGIFIFESKNFSGRIYGLAGQREWFHTFRTAKGIKKQRFFNPLMQNGAHLTALSRLVPENVPLYPMVVFGSNAELFTPEAENSPDRLMTLGKLPGRVKALRKNSKFSCEYKELYNLLKPYTAVDIKMKNDHIAMVTQKNLRKRK